MDRDNLELCLKGQDGIQFHAMIFFHNGRVWFISGYDHDNASHNAIWPPVYFDSEPQHRISAALILAAPELLDACKLARQSLDLDIQAIDRLDQAIARAERTI